MKKISKHHRAFGLIKTLIGVKQLKLGSVALVFSLSTSFVLTSQANATSNYDDYYHTTSSIELMSADLNCSLDISDSWMNKLGGYTSSLQSAINNGGTYGVSELPRYSVDATNNVTKKAVIVYWNTSGIMTTQWPNWGYITVSNFTHSVLLELSSCSGSVSVSNYGGAYISSNDGAVTNYLFNGQLQKPDSNYAGEEIVTPAVLEGNVQCFNDNDLTSSISVNPSSGLGGYAVLNDDGVGGKNFSFRLSSNPSSYNLTILCGNSIMGTPSTTTLSQFNTWYCSDLVMTGSCYLQN